ncbi:DUF3240 family protein [Methyloradius palustris]|uniref:DUF3240 domain-containing protein n=1 Tax=Methyloradius palustris TaxID=2778876 RepID=A0A8D5FYU7_9PROT|nr:DUF3240 family protein [Methyloradius palustris]BCM24694.1 hypothetical protein ZMTM_09530 [Methyloradius palustris]
MSQHLLTIITLPRMQDAMIDWLLEQDNLSGFSTAEIYGHGARHTGMSLLEQVTGRQKRTQFTAHADEAVINSVLEKLKLDFAGSGLHYMVTPLLEAGAL